MTSARWDDDDVLLIELQAALEAQAVVPDHVVTAARAAYTWRTIDEELAFAALVFDSSLEPSALVRGSGPRILLFEGAGLSVEVEVDDGIVVGQLIPPCPGRISLMNAAGTFAEAQADEVGCFTLQRPETGPVRLICRSAGDALTTPWLPL